MTKSIVQLAAGTFALLLLTEATAYGGSAPVMKSRCSEDSLDPGPATERIEWAAKCGHITPSERQYSLQDGTQTRPRPLYPMYATEDMGQMWKAPVDRNAPCSLPGGMGVVAFCTASCYTPDQMLLFPEGFVRIDVAKNQVLPDVTVLRDSSTFDNLKFASYPVESYTEEIRPSWQDILKFKMKSGGSLKVTTNHPLMDGSGALKTADKFKVGENVVHYLYGLDPIVSITPQQFFGKVYNLAPNTRLPLSNVVVAEGYLNGSSYFQNDGQDLQNRALLRRTLPQNLVH